MSWMWSMICSAEQTASERPTRSGLVTPMISSTRRPIGVGGRFAVREDLVIGRVATHALVGAGRRDEVEERLRGEATTASGRLESPQQRVARCVSSVEDTCQIGLEGIQQGERVVGLRGAEAEQGRLGAGGPVAVADVVDEATVAVHGEHIGAPGAGQEERCDEVVLA